jgi:3-hydroxybutyryl-CoA dehydrogenase
MKTFVIGAGTMGSGIAQVFAAAGYETTVYDISEELAAGGKKRIESALARQLHKGNIDEAKQTEILNRLFFTADLSMASGCEFVIEAAVEDMAIKKKVFTEIARICAVGCILATNTSSLSITEIAFGLPCPGQVIGMHFFNPAPAMKLVEVINGDSTAPKVTEKVMDIARSLGKEPVIAQEAPGFIVNRLLIPMINEAAFILSEGVASAEDIDKAMMLGANHPMGPLQLSDLIGNDVSLAIMETLLRETGDPRYRPCPLLRKMVRSGRLGRKTGRGFFKY